MGGNGKAYKHCPLNGQGGTSMSSVAQIISVKMYTVHIPEKHTVQLRAATKREIKTLA